MATTPDRANGRGLLGRVEHELDLSRFLAARGDRPPAIEVPDVVDVQRLLTALSRASRREFLTLHDGVASAAAAPALPPADPEIIDHNLAMLRRGVVVHEVITDAARAAVESTAAVATALDGHGGEVRIISAVPVKLSLVDRSIAVLPLEPDAKTFRLGALVVTDPAVVRALHAAATMTWAAARPLAGRPDPPPSLLRPVLDALLEGRTDAAAARRLHVSPRTYTRRMADLLDLLGVSTRAQAVAAARKRGWLDD